MKNNFTTKEDLNNNSDDLTYSKEDLKFRRKTRKLKKYKNENFQNDQENNKYHINENNFLNEIEDEDDLKKSKESLLNKILKLEENFEENKLNIENFLNSKKQNFVSLDNNINDNLITLENHKAKKNIVYKEFEELKKKLDIENQIFSEEIIFKKTNLEKEISECKNNHKNLNTDVITLKKKSEQYYNNLSLLEEDYKTQQNLMINHTSKYETLNHLLNLVLVDENNLTSYKSFNILNIDDENNSNKFNSGNNKINFFHFEDQNILNNHTKNIENSNNSDINKLIPHENRIKNNIESYQINNFEEVNENSDNSVKNNNNFKYVSNNKKYYSDSENQNKSYNIDDNSLEKNFAKDCENNKNKKKISDNFIEINNKQTFMDKNDFQQNQKEKKFDFQEFHSYEFLLLDLNSFSFNLLEKLTNGKKNLFPKLTHEYLKENFCKIFDLINFKKNSSKINSAKNSSNNISCDDDLNNKNNILHNNNKKNNFKKIKFSNKIISDYSNKNLRKSDKEETDINKNNNLIDENFLLGLLIKDLIIITGIKYENIQRIIYLLIKINYIDKNIKLRQKFILYDYPLFKKNLMNKILSIEERIEIKYEKIQKLNFCLKKKEKNIAEINKIFAGKKLELEENKYNLENLEKDLFSLKENEENLKLLIDNLIKEKFKKEKEFNEKINLLNNSNNLIQEKLKKLQKKFNFIKEQTIIPPNNNDDQNFLKNKTNLFNQNSPTNKYRRKRNNSTNFTNFNEIGINKENHTKIKENFHRKINFESQNNISDSDRNVDDYNNCINFKKIKNKSKNQSHSTERDTNKEFRVNNNIYNKIPLENNFKKKKDFSEELNNKHKIKFSQERSHKFSTIKDTQLNNIQYNPINKINHNDISSSNLNKVNNSSNSESKKTEPTNFHKKKISKEKKKIPEKEKYMDSFPIEYDKEKKYYKPKPENIEYNTNTFQSKCNNDNKSNDISYRENPEKNIFKRKENSTINTQDYSLRENILNSTTRNFRNLNIKDINEKDSDKDKSRYLINNNNKNKFNHLNDDNISNFNLAENKNFYYNKNNQENFNNLSINKNEDFINNDEQELPIYYNYKAEEISKNKFLHHKESEKNYLNKNSPYQNNHKTFSEYSNISARKLRIPKYNRRENSSIDLNNINKINKSNQSIEDYIIKNQNNDYNLYNDNNYTKSPIFYENKNTKNPQDNFSEYSKNFENKSNLTEYFSDVKSNKFSKINHPYNNNNNNFNSINAKMRTRSTNITNFNTTINSNRNENFSNYKNNFFDYENRNLSSIKYKTIKDENLNYYECDTEKYNLEKNNKKSTKNNKNIVQNRDFIDNFNRNNYNNQIILDRELDKIYNNKFLSEKNKEFNDLNFSYKSRYLKDNFQLFEKNKISNNYHKEKDLTLTENDYKSNFNTTNGNSYRNNINDLNNNDNLNRFALNKDISTNKNNFNYNLQYYTEYYTKNKEENIFKNNYEKKLNNSKFNGEFNLNIKLEQLNYQEKIRHLEQGCLILKRNNYKNKKKHNFFRLVTNNFNTENFDPLENNFKKYFCAFDKIRNKLIFTKQSFSDKTTDVYLASITSIKIPQYTKNLVFVKQIYKKFSKNFESFDELDNYLNDNTHFLVNLFYNNCGSDSDIKFDNRLYSKDYRRMLFEDNNYIIYLNLLSEGARIEMIFLEYDIFKYWLNGLEDLINLKNC